MLRERDQELHKKHVNVFFKEKKILIQASGSFWAKNDVKPCFLHVKGFIFSLRSDKVYKRKRGVLHIFTLVLQRT